MAEYIDKQAVMDALKQLPHEYKTKEQRARTGGIAACQMVVKDIPATDVVSWAYLERYANWFCADVSFPEFIREAKAFLAASGGFQEGSQIYG